MCLGSTKPATPMTSLTLTEMARIPAVIVGRQAGARPNRRQLGVGDWLVFADGVDEAAIHDFFGPC